MRTVVLVIAALVLTGCSRMNAPAKDYADEAVMMEAPSPVAGSAQRSAQATTQMASAATAPMIATTMSTRSGPPPAGSRR
jgi:uncharacterized protein YcfL